ncbi:MAG: polysaccharide export protein, partial [Gammaproteobacteria bacterium]|nr:polysaccharide export protein [Gammaproteobacteria bacterium]
MTRLLIATLLLLVPLLVTALEPSAYRLASGDTIEISVYGEEDLSLTVQLDDKGSITYPLLGIVPVTGKTVSELENLMRDRLSGRFLVSPQVTIGVKEYRRFFINGEVRKPGGYAYLPGLTLRKAAALAGGFTDKASVDHVYVIHEKDPLKQRASVDLDRPVNAGDIITVPEFKQIFISGEVKKPGRYDFQSELTLRKVVALAGGFTPRASEEKIFIIRVDTEDQIR